MGQNSNTFSKDNKNAKASKPNPKPRDVIYDPMGQWKYPGQVTRIPSNQITMQGVNYPVLGIDNFGNQQMMQPGLNYTFPGQYVTEYPQMQNGGTKNHNDSTFENIFEIIDPTGISSWDDVYRSYNESGMSNQTGLEILGALPLLGKFGKGIKVLSGLGKTSKQIGSVKRLGNAFIGAGIIGKGIDAQQAYEQSRAYEGSYKQGGWLDEYGPGGENVIETYEGDANWKAALMDKEIREFGNSGGYVDNKKGNTQGIKYNMHYNNAVPTPTPTPTSQYKEGYNKGFYGQNPFGFFVKDGKPYRGATFEQFNDPSKRFQEGGESAPLSMEELISRRGIAPTIPPVEETPTTVVTPSPVHTPVPIVNAPTVRKSNKVVPIVNPAPVPRVTPTPRVTAPITPIINVPNNSNTPTKFSNNLSDVAYTDYELKTYQKQYDERMEKCMKNNKGESLGCLEQANKYYDSYVAPFLSLPSSVNLANKLNAPSGPTNPRYKDYGESVDSWDMAGVMKENGDIMYYNAPRNNPTELQDKLNKLNEADKTKYFKSLNLPIGTIVNFGANGEKHNYANSPNTYNAKNNLVSSNHSARIAGYNEEGVPMIYDLGQLRPITDPHFSMPVTNIIASKELKDYTYDYLKANNKLDEKFNPLTIKGNDIKYDEDEYPQFLNEIYKNKELFANTFGMNNADYDQYAKHAAAMALTETGGGDNTSIRWKYGIPIPAYALDTVGDTQGITQVNTDMIFKNKKIAAELANLGFSQTSYDPSNPFHIAAATMALLKANKHTQNINAKTKGNKANMSDAEKTYYQWNAPGALVKGQAKGDSEKVKKYIENYNKLTLQQNGGWLDTYQTGGEPTTFSNAMKRAMVKPPFVYKEPVVPTTIKLEDNRKIRATTKKPINPNTDLKGGDYNIETIHEIIKEAKRRGYDPATAVAVGLGETNLGKADFQNVGHSVNGKGFNQYEWMLDYLQKSKDSAIKKGYMDEPHQLQFYNGTGKLYPSTESGYRGYNAKSYYGVPVPPQGLDMMKNPLYGTNIIDLRDNVIKQNADISKMIDTTSVYKYGGGLTDYQGLTRNKKNETRKNIKTSINKLMERNVTLYGPAGHRYYNPNSKYQNGGETNWLDSI